MTRRDIGFVVSRKTKIILAIAAIALVATLGRITAPARAATRSIDGSQWAVNGGDILLRVIVPDQVWRHLPGAHGGIITDTALGQYILDHYGAKSAGGNCPAIDLGYDLGKITPMALISGERRYEAMLRCPSDKGITLTDNAFFAEIPGHRGAVSITINNGPPVRQEFSAHHRAIALPALSLSPLHETGEGFGNFWHSLDLMLFVLGMVALCGLSRALLWPLAGFAGGALLSLALAGLHLADPVGSGWVAAYLLLVLGGEIAGRSPPGTRDPRVAYGFAAVSLLVAGAAIARHEPWLRVVALVLLGTGYLRWRALRPDAKPLWLIPAALLGLAEGLDDWPDLSFFARPAPLPLGAFDLGTLLGAASLCALCWLARRRVRLAGWSPALAAAALTGFGGYLVLTRL